jgi:hypothetical protein
MRINVGLGICFAAAVTLAAADLPYAGKWKANLAKSDFGQTTITYEQMSGGEMKATIDGQSYTFKMDGKDVPTPWGTTAAWKAVDGNTWETTDKTNGKVVGTDVSKLSADGKSLTVDSKMMNADGGSHTDIVDLRRVSGGPGLAGKWQTKNIRSSAPSTLELAASGADGLRFTFVNEGSVCDARFDGKDYPATGPIWPSGWTCSIAKNGARAFDITWKKDGKPMYKSTMTASADGRTLTETGGAIAASEKIKAVYDRQ